MPKNIKAKAGSAPQHNIVFVHMPKCGGTSLNAALVHQSVKYRWRIRQLDAGRSKAASDLLGIDLLEFRSCQLATELNAATSSQTGILVSGQYTLNETILNHYRDLWNFVTVLRDPVSRWISHYSYSRSKNDGVRVAHQIDQFIDSDAAIKLGNLYVRHLTTGQRNLSSAEEIASAQRTIQSFSCVGVLENLSRFVEKLHTTFGFAVNIGYANKNPTSADETSRLITPERRRKIEAFCEPDLAVYETAAKMNRA